MRGSDSTKGGSSPKEAPTHCYLCGRPLSCPTSKDHCPPRTLFSPEIGRQHNLSQLITIRVHKNCNASYQRDEEYFKATLVPFARGSVAGDPIYSKFIADSRENERKLILAESILREFEPRPGGLHLPSGLVVKRQDGARIKRVAWKIVRGLNFHHHSPVLPEALPVDETHGRYPGVFDYRFRVFETDLGKLNYWAFLIWDRIILTVHFHDPSSCQCEDCTSAVAEMEMRAGRAAV